MMKRTVFLFMATALTMALVSGCAQHLLIDSKPAGASIFVNNQYRGETPQALLMNLGYYNVRIEKYGFERYESMVDVANEELRLDVRLKILVGTIEFYSEHKDVQIFLDGQYLGKTPLSATVPVGKHLVKAVKTEHEPWERTVTIEHGRIIKQTISLTAAQGLLQVTTDKAGAEVWLNDKLIGTTPLEKRVPIGAYLLKIKLEGYETFDIPIDLEPEPAVKKISVTLKKRLSGSGNGHLLADSQTTATDVTVVTQATDEKKDTRDSETKDEQLQPTPLKSITPVKVIFSDLGTVKRIFQGRAKEFAHYLGDIMQHGDSVGVGKNIGCTKSRGNDQALQSCLNDFLAGKAVKTTSEENNEGGSERKKASIVAVNVYGNGKKTGRGIVLNQFDLQRPIQNITMAFETGRGFQLVIATLPEELTDDAKRLTVILNEQDSCTNFIVGGSLQSGIILKNPKGVMIQMKKTGQIQRAYVSKPGDGTWTLEWQTGKPPAFVLVTSQKRIKLPSVKHYSLKQGEKIIISDSDSIKGFKLQRVSILDEEMKASKLSSYEMAEDEHLSGKTPLQLEIGPLSKSGLFNRTWRMTLKDQNNRISQRQFSTSYMVSDEKINTESKDFFRR